MDREGHLSSANLQVLIASSPQASLKGPVSGIQHWLGSRHGCQAGFWTHSSCQLGCDFFLLSLPSLPSGDRRGKISARRWRDFVRIEGECWDPRAQEKRHHLGHQEDGVSEESSLVPNLRTTKPCLAGQHEEDVGTH